MIGRNLNKSLPQENYCFCELAPLYALDLLTAAERQWVEQQILECPALIEELTQYEMAVTAIPYGTELVPDNIQDIKGRLFDRLSLDAPPESETRLTTPASNVLSFASVRSDNLRWINPGIAKVEVAMLHIDWQKRERVGLLRAEPGMKYPPHRHGGTEEIYMLSGDLTLEGVTYYAGDYLRSKVDSAHGVAYSVSGCMFYFRSSIDDQYPISVVSANIFNTVKDYLVGFFKSDRGQK